MNRREWLSTAAAGLCTPAGAAPATRPNILMLFADDQRFDTIHALGNSAIRTPNLDRLVARGVSFTHAFIQGGTVPAVCMPSRMMMISGQHLFHASKFMQGMPADAPPFHMWPEELRKAGYRTWSTGKWHNSPKLHARCFSDGANVFLGGMGVQEAMPVHDFNAQGDYVPAKARKSGKLAAELFADGAVAFVKGHKGPEPFAAYVAFTVPHDPRTAPAEYYAMYPPDRMEVPASFMPEHPFDNGELRVRDELLAPFPRTQEVIRKHTSDYYATITHMDAQIGRILDALEASPHASNTLVVFSADNGLALGRHGLMGKQNLYDHSVRVPMIVAGPGVPKGEKRDQLVHVHDLCPTFLEAAGVAVPPTVESRSLLPVIHKKSVRTRDSVFSAYRQFQRGIRTKEWKLIRYNVGGQQTVQLFRIGEDPDELRDLSKDPKHAGRIRNMTAELQAAMKQAGDVFDLSQPDWGFVPPPKHA